MFAEPAMAVKAVAVTFATSAVREPTAMRVPTTMAAVPMLFLVPA